MPQDRQYILNFLNELSIRKIPGIGGMTETTLNEIGIVNVKDLVEKAADLMIGYSTYPKTHQFLIHCGLGIGQERHDYDPFE